MNKITAAPIETEYRGHIFRSRLKARFAVFFDCLRCDWLYEPEGFSLPSGNYLPDFFLPSVGHRKGTWIEVKPWGKDCYFGMAHPRGSSYALDDRYGEFLEYADSVEQDFFIAYGIPSEAYFDDFDYSQCGMLETPFDPFMWCFCPCSKTLGIEFDGRGARVNCDCNKHNSSDKCYSHDHDRIRQAAAAARNFRFEYSDEWRPDLSFLKRKDLDDAWKSRMLNFFYGGFCG